MQRGTLYPYRTTYDKLTEHMATLEDEGDAIEHVIFVGGRDWVLICRKGTR